VTNESAVAEIEAESLASANLKRSQHVGATPVTALWSCNHGTFGPSLRATPVPTLVLARQSVEVPWGLSGPVSRSAVLRFAGEGAGDWGYSLAARDRLAKRRLPAAVANLDREPLFFDGLIRIQL